MGIVPDAQPRSCGARGEGRFRTRNDQTYKAFYELVGSLRNLLYGYLPERSEGAAEWFELVNFECAEFISTAHTTTDLASRTINIQRKVPIGKGRPAGTDRYMVVMLEFQSRVDHYEPSHVLTAMGLPREQIDGAIRISWSHTTEPVDWGKVRERIASLQG